MAEKEVNTIIVLEPCTPAVEELLKKVEGANQAELVRLASPDEAVQLVRQYQPCMLVACTINNADIPVRVNMLKKLESSVKSGVLKTLFVSKLKNRQLGTLITSLGVTDFIEEPVPARTLQFKTNLQLKAVETIKKQQAMKKASQEKIVFKKSELKQENGAQPTTDVNAKSKPALQLEEDTFLFKNSGVKKVGKKTLVELEGPTPDSGEWVPHEDKGDAKTSWRWMPNEKKSLPPEQAKQEGWVHEGEKPAFNEESGKWQFNSEKPDLSFQKNGKKVGSKISTDEQGEVVVADDSPMAEENVKKAKESSQQKKDTKKQEAATDRKAKADAKEKEADQAATLRQINKTKDQKKEELPTSIHSKEEADPAQELTVNKKEKKKESELEKRLAKAMDSVNEEKPSQEEINDLVKDETEEKVTKSPLDFLKKKREQKEKREVDSVKVSEDKVSNTDNVLALTTKEELSPEEQKSFGKTEKQTKQEKPKKSAADAAKEVLERLKKKVETSSKNKTSEEHEQDSGQSFSKSEELEDGEKLESLRGNKKDPEQDTKKQISSDKRNTKEPLENETKKESGKKLSPEERKAKKREILAEIQAVLKKPTPETISNEEEMEIRKKLGLENKKEISAKELAKRAKLERVKELKEKLDELNGYKETEGEFKQHDLSQDELDDTWSRKGFAKEKPGRKINAFDSEASKESDWDSVDAKKAKEQKFKAREKKPIEDRYVYLAEAEVQPIGGAWELAGEYYVFLAATVRYKGFDRLDDVCPLQFYRGEKIPEFLDKTKQWRFIDTLPLKAERSADIPKDIRDFLFNLKAQIHIDSETESQKDKTESEAPLDLGRKKKDSKFNHQKENRNSGEDEILPDLNQEIEEDFGNTKSDSSKNREAEESLTQKKSTKKGNSKVADLMAALEKEEGELKNSEESEQSAEPFTKSDSLAEADTELKPSKDKNRDIGSILEALEKDERKLNENSVLEEETESANKTKLSTPTEIDEPSDKPKETGFDESITKNETDSTSDSSAESISSDDSKNRIEAKQETGNNESVEIAEKKKNRSKESNDLEDRLAALKAKMEDPFNETEAPVKNTESVNEDFTPEKGKPAVPVSAEGLESVKEKLRAESPALDKFLERRKQKKDRPIKSPAAATQSKVVELAKNTPFLSIYVAVSNAFNASGSPTVSVQRVLRSIEDSFENCTAYIFFDKGPVESGTVEISSNGTGIGQKIPISSGLACPIQFGVGSEEGSFLGYLFLKPAGTREYFSSAEEDTANKVATSLWSILSGKERNEAKAA